MKTIWIPRFVASLSILTAAAAIGGYVNFEAARRSGDAEAAFANGIGGAAMTVVTALIFGTAAMMELSRRR